MIQQIDHILLVVPELDRAREIWRAAGCPLLWDGTWNDAGASVPLFGVSVGPLNLEILSAQALPLFGLPEGAFGVASVAFDPGDTGETVQRLRQAGFPIAEPRPWRAGATFVSATSDTSLPSGGVNTPLGDALPGLPAFLSEYLPPHRHRGRTRPDSPVRFVELRIRRPDPGAVVPVYERALSVRAVREGGEFLLPLGDTPLRLAPAEMASGAGRDVVLTAHGDGVPTEALSRAVPGLCWR